MAATINDRIESLINERFDGNKAAFCKTIGLPSSGMSNYLGKQRRSKPSVDMITKIITKLGVDPGWLLTGEETQRQERYVQTGERSFMAKTIQHLSLDQRNIGEEKMVKEKTDVGEEIVLPPDCPDEMKHSLNILQAQMGLLDRLIEEKDKLIAEKDKLIDEKENRITELKERIEEMKIRH